jgi:VCBS repeat-containing protein
LQTVTSNAVIDNLDALVLKAEFGPVSKPLGAGFLAFTINTASASVSGSGVTAGWITEGNAALSTSGQLPSTVDAAAVTYVASTHPGEYGSLVLLSSGAWKYTMDGAYNEFVAGEERVETFTVEGTNASGQGVSKTVTVTLQGTNDAAVIKGSASKTISETDAPETITGQLTATDVDSSAEFVAQQNVTNANGYGTFSLTESGAWTYVMDASHDEFVAGKTYTDTFVATTTDGTRQIITVKINGTSESIARDNTSAELAESTEPTEPTISVGLMTFSTPIDQSANLSLSSPPTSLTAPTSPTFTEREGA